MRFILSFVIFTTVVSWGVGCGDEGPSADVDVLIDGKPRVSLSKRTIRNPYDGSDGFKPTPPHFHFDLSIRNRSDKTLVVEGFRLEVFTKGNFTGEPSGTTDFFPDICPFNREKNENPCGLFDANTFKVLGAKSEVVTLPITFYMHSLPDNEGSYVYRLRLELFGFFSEETDPYRAILKESDRLKKVISFSTE